jgi:hypothetical protein
MKIFPPRFKPYFCLDTSLITKLAYANRCNWGNILERLDFCLFSPRVGKIVSAVCGSTRFLASSLSERSGPAHQPKRCLGGIIPKPSFRGATNFVLVRLLSAF